MPEPCVLTELELFALGRQGRRDLSQSMAREVEISGEALMKMPLHRKLALLETIPALKYKLWCSTAGSQERWDPNRQRIARSRGPSNSSQDKRSAPSLSASLCLQTAYVKPGSYLHGEASSFQQALLAEELHS